MPSADRKIHFLCGKCGAKYVATANQAGKIGKCKTCGVQISVPPEEQADYLRSADTKPVPPSPMKCSNCNKPISEDDCFCLNCGFNLKSMSQQGTKHSAIFCHRCGNLLGKGVKFCDKCGATLIQKSTLNSGQVGKIPKPSMKKHMALINCPECGTEVSKEAASCPKCGHPFKKTAQGMSGCGLFFVIVAAIVVAAIAISFGL